MLSDEQLEIISEAIQPLFQYLEKEVIADIARRIQKTLTYTRTAELQALSMRELGYSPARIRKEVMKILNADPEYRKQVAKNTLEYKRYVRDIIHEITKEAYKANNELVANAGNMAWINDLSVWKDAGKTLADNSYLSQLTEAFSSQTAGELKNLTRTTGFRSMRGCESIGNAYRKELDRAVIKICSGTFSHERALRDTVHNLAQSGLRSIDFESGYSMQLDTAVRLAIRTGCHQLAGKVMDKNIAQSGENLVYVDKHIGARNTGTGHANHEQWQGKVYYVKPGHDYTDEARRIGQKEITDLWEATGYSCDGTHENDPLGLYGYNCGHHSLPWFEGASTFPPELQEPPPVTINGKTYDYYAMTQKMRAMERGIRALKREKETLAALGMDTTEIRAKIRRKTAEYKEFCKMCNIRPKTERLRYECGTSDLKRTEAWGKYETEKKQNAERMNESISKELLRFEGNNTVFNGKTPIEKCEIAKSIIEKYVNRKSKWKGIVKVNDEKCRRDGIAGRKEWSCEILVSSKTQPKTYIHEMLHSSSGSYLNPVSYIQYRKMEEASTEFFAREICKKEEISYRYKNRLDINSLIEINQIIKIKKNDFDFAKVLYNKDIQIRYIWLENKVKRYLADYGGESQKYLEQCLKELKEVNLWKS